MAAPDKGPVPVSGTGASLATRDMAEGSSDQEGMDVDVLCYPLIMDYCGVCGMPPEV